MKKLPSFFFGMFVGAILMFVTLKYHIVHANEGWHWIPKSSAQLTFPYVDIRGFTLQDWDQHRELAIDIAQSDQRHLLEEATRSTFDNTVRDVLDGFNDRRP